MRGFDKWCRETAGQRTHGTTKQQPLARFQRVEQATLVPLPRTPYDPASWKQVTVYRDCYVTFDGAYYSVPFRLVGQPVWVRRGARTVEIYTAEHALVATHDRAREPGQRQTLLDHRPEDRLRSAAHVLRLATTYGTERLERACARAQYFGESDYPAVKRILAAGRDAGPLPLAAPPAVPPRSTFVRQAGEFVASLLGGGR